MIDLIEKVKDLTLEVIEHSIALVLLKRRYSRIHLPRYFCFANQRPGDWRWG